MHESSFNEMKRLVQFFVKLEQKTNILDVGSFDFNGSYKSIFDNNINWTYLGIDQSEGKNVDLVVKPFNWDLPSNYFDLIISGQCLEHVSKPWLWILEVERVCKKGGIVIITAPWNCQYHPMPIDCWRILPDGMRVLLTEVAHMKLHHCEITNETDTFAIAEKL
jgi:SAM-dependent methyltransferase